MRWAEHFPNVANKAIPDNPPGPMNFDKLPNNNLPKSSRLMVTYGPMVMFGADLG